MEPKIPKLLQNVKKSHSIMSIILYLGYSNMLNISAKFHLPSKGQA